MIRSRFHLSRVLPVLALFVLALAGGCGDSSSPPGRGPGSTGADGVTLREGDPPPPLPDCDAPLPPFEIDEIATGLEVPWDLAQAPDGRLFVTERPGRIRVIENGILREAPWFEIDVEHRDEIGLLGIVLAPDFGDTGHLFVVSSHFRPEPLGGFPVLGWVLRRVRNRLPGDGGTSMITRVQRITDQGGSGADPTPWVDNLPAGIIHAGGALRLHPDGGMLLSLGDGMAPWSAQDPESLRGAILHIPSTSEPPPGHRLRTSDHVLAKGVRNSQGIGFLGGSDRRTTLFIDHGPTGLASEARRLGKDELNLLDPGANYGWPVEAGRFPDSRFLQPLVEWTPALAPGGMATLPGDGMGGDPATTARVLLTGLRGERLVQVVMVRDAARSWSPTCQHRLLGDEWGRFRAVLAGADGDVYLSTSNRDGRGVPGPGDDRILRIRWN